MDLRPPAWSAASAGTRALRPMGVGPGSLTGTRSSPCPSARPRKRRTAIATAGFRRRVSLNCAADQPNRHPHRAVAAHASDSSSPPARSPPRRHAGMSQSDVPRQPASMPQPTDGICGVPGQARSFTPDQPCGLPDGHAHRSVSQRQAIGTSTEMPSADYHYGFRRAPPGTAPLTSKPPAALCRLRPRFRQAADPLRPPGRSQLPGGMPGRPNRTFLPPASMPPAL